MLGAACPAHANILLAVDETKYLSEQQVGRTLAEYFETVDVTVFGYDEEGLQGIASTSTTSLRNASLEIHGSHRRELVVKLQDEKFSTLEGIYLEFKAFLNNLLPSPESAPHRRRGRDIVKTLLRCPGYIRSEISLTPSITPRTTVSCYSPFPNQICPKCNRVVPKDVEIFDCICGEG